MMVTQSTLTSIWHATRSKWQRYASFPLLKAIGLKAFMRPTAMERIIRDLTTYMRQPALDLSLASAGFYLRHQDKALKAADFFAAVNTLPPGSLDTITKDSGLVIVAPHPHDESLECSHPRRKR